MRACRSCERVLPTFRTRPLYRLRRPPYSPLSGSHSVRPYSDLPSTQNDTQTPKSLSVPTTPRYNPIGVEQLSSHLHSQLFPTPSSPPSEELVEISKAHLRAHDLLGKNVKDADARPISCDLPPLHGASVDEHFYKLGMDAAEPYLSISQKFARANAPPKPRKWARRSGWTKYLPDGSWEPVDAPEGDAIVFDTEVMWKESKFACLAVAASRSAWFGWMSPWLLKESESDQHLIPLGDTSVPRIIVGHNIGYDRARTLEEYSLQQSSNFFIDTMSLHVAVNGMCSRQRPTWMKHRKDRELRDKMAESDDASDLSVMIESGMSQEEEELWVGRSSMNSLREVAQFHCGIAVDKSRREYFGELDRDGVLERLDELMDYCAADVEVTHMVYRKVFPSFLETCPHPVSFAALRHLSTEILPVNKSWETYIAKADEKYRELSGAVTDRLRKLAQRAVNMRKRPTAYESDPWLSQLDWSGQEIKYCKPKKAGETPRPMARQKAPGMPKWYKDLLPTSAATEPVLTVRTRVAALLLRLSWDGFPLVWSDKFGFVYKVPYEKAAHHAENGATECNMVEDENISLQDDVEHRYFKLPHKDGPSARCANPLAKGYLPYFESGRLSSEYSYAKAALEMNASCSYWISARDRIMSQMVVYLSSLDENPKSKRKRSKSTTTRRKKVDPNDIGIILPQLIPMGTITRRSVENTWLTASNAKKNRVGSELKSCVVAPPGYAFVGADVDSEELWIASLLGDAQFGLHGGGALGFMTLEGEKKAGTDLHSRTASILGISRNDAKVFNYGRIYGAGVKFASTLLRQFSPSIAESEAIGTSQALYTQTKGKRTMRRALHDRSFWRGGSESLVFNTLEDFAELTRPRTPVLGAGITEALHKRFISKGAYLTSRVNWAIQSSGVDYLHLLIVAMDYLIRKFLIDARLSLTVHDEIRYLVAEKDKYRTAMALQVANIWTRALFAERVGIMDLPAGVAFFSAVDVDHVLRKEVDMDCVTPSQPNPIPAGESLDIDQLLDLGEVAMLQPPSAEVRSAETRATMQPPNPDRFPYEPTAPVMRELASQKSTAVRLAYLRAQVCESDTELRQILQELRLAEKDSSRHPSLASDEFSAVDPQNLKQGKTAKPRKRANKSGRNAGAARSVGESDGKGYSNYVQSATLVPVDLPESMGVQGHVHNGFAGWRGYGHNGVHVR
ncbi:DNA polymerase gamma [Eremomyces bilateralis CBS 781.70]|uniref:DNA-directed DNA polymerase n=1 Tax=Eremomyces bilateralis CBS 781.70 TaxID=1392243 RepID=A0A6G1FR94_9PEZI|nr:DNA polymerase gamma [Eremomyces bilateralis CBS 781.70]KAF1808314.1 DNA polymerase gamma [Eremomyces bilateralis CBS 781.70]